MKTLVLQGDSVISVPNIKALARKGNRLSFKYFGGHAPGHRRYVAVEGISPNGNLIARDCRVTWSHGENNYRQFKPCKMAEIRLIRGKLA